MEQNILEYYINDIMHLLLHIHIYIYLLCAGKLNILYEIN